MLQRPLTYRQDAAVGPALGAARLAQLAVEKSTVTDVCSEAPVDFTVSPKSGEATELDSKYLEFKALYDDLKPHFGRQAG